MKRKLQKKLTQTHEDYQTIIKKHENPLRFRRRDQNGTKIAKKLPNLSPKATKMMPKGSIGAKSGPRDPNWSHKAPKTSQRGAKGRQREPTVSQKSIKMHPKIGT